VVILGVVVLLLIAAGLAAGTWRTRASLFPPNNAQVDGDRSPSTSPGAGTLTGWVITQGHPGTNTDQVVGRIQILVPAANDH